MTSNWGSAAGEGAEEAKTERGLTAGADSQQQLPGTAQDAAPAQNQDEEGKNEEGTNEEAKNEEVKSVPQSAE